MQKSENISKNSIQHKNSPGIISITNLQPLQFCFGFQ